jgi:hypothetical protein
VFTARKTGIGRRRLFQRHFVCDAQVTLDSIVDSYNAIQHRFRGSYARGFSLTQRVAQFRQSQLT